MNWLKDKLKESRLVRFSTLTLAGFSFLAALKIAPTVMPALFVALILIGIFWESSK